MIDAYLEVSPPTLIRMLPWSSSAFNLIAFMAFLLSPEKSLFLGLLGRIVILGFPDPPSTSIVLIGLGLI